MKIINTTKVKILILFIFFNKIEIINNIKRNKNEAIIKERAM